MLLQHQFSEHVAETAKQQSRTPHRINIPLFAPLIGKVSTYALHKLYEQLEISRRRDFVAICQDSYRLVMGLPCAHFIHQQTTRNLPIRLEHVHRHWFFEPLRAPTGIDLVLDPPLNPLPARTRGRPRGSRSTRRNLSQFERMTRSRQLQQQGNIGIAE